MSLPGYHGDVLGLATPLTELTNKVAKLETAIASAVDKMRGKDRAGGGGEDMGWRRWGRGEKSGRGGAGRGRSDSVGRHGSRDATERNGMIFDRHND